MYLKEPLGSGRSIWVFLDGACFAANLPVYEGWKHLDFLGFSRPNLYFSIGYERFRGKNFSRPFPCRSRRPEREPAVEAMWKVRLHQARLNYLLIFRNRNCR